MRIKRITATMAGLATIAVGGFSAIPAHAEPNVTPIHLDVVKVDAKTGALLPGAHITGQFCNQGADDVNANCENLDDYSWFKDSIPEFGTTDPTSSFSEQLPLSTNSSIGIQEASSPVGYATAKGTARLNYNSSDGTWAINTSNPDGFQLTKTTYTASDGSTQPAYRLAILDQPAAGQGTVYSSGDASSSSSDVLFQKVDAVSGAVIPGAVMKGESCTRPSADADWSCEDLSQYSWFRDNITKTGTTDGLDNGFQSNIALASGFDADGNPTTLDNTLQKVDFSEDTAPAGYAKIKSQIEIYRTGNTWASATFNNATSRVVTSNNFVKMQIVDPRAATITPSETDVAGPNNDQVSATVTGLTKTSDSGWVNGVYTQTYTVDTGYLYTDSNGKAFRPGSVVTVKWTDNGSTTTSTPAPVTTCVPGTVDPKTVIGTFQVDTYATTWAKGSWVGKVQRKVATPMAAADRAKIASYDDDGVLGYREDMQSWGASTVKFVNVTQADVNKYGSLQKAVEGLTNTHLTLNTTAAPAAGTSVTQAWMLGKGATQAQPWGASKNINQVALAKVVLPQAAKVCTTTTPAPVSVPVNAKGTVTVTAANAGGGSMGGGFGGGGMGS